MLLARAVRHGGSPRLRHFAEIASDLERRNASG